MTKSEARKVTHCKTYSELAIKLGTSRQTVSAWGSDDDPIPQGREWQIKVMLAEGLKNKKNPSRSRGQIQHKESK